MKYFAIRHNPSGRFLPGGKRRCGFTHDVPMPPTQVPPRLFLTNVAAQNALAWWLAGTTVVKRIGGSMLEEDSEDWQTTPAPDRKKEDMEIVPVELRII